MKGRIHVTFTAGCERRASSGKRHMSAMMMPAKISQQRLLLLLGLAAVLVLLAGGWCYRAQEHQVRHDAEAILQGAARLKAEQIVGWRKHTLGGCGGAA